MFLSRLLVLSETETETEIETEMYSQSRDGIVPNYCYFDERHEDRDLLIKQTREKEGHESPRLSVSLSV